MRRKAFVGSSEGILQAVIHEGIDRKGTHCILAFPSATEDQPIPTGFNPKHFVPIEEVPEFSDDEELRLVERLDKGEVEPETFDSIGNEPRFKLPGRVVKMVERVIHPERKSAMTAACFNVRTGLLVCVY